MPWELRGIHEQPVMESFEVGISEKVTVPPLRQWYDRWAGDTRNCGTFEGSKDTCQPSRRTDDIVVNKADHARTSAS